MEHGDVVNRLDEYRDGELPAGVAREIAGHLETCSSCRAVLDDQAARARSLSGLVRAQPSDAFVRTVMERIAAEEAPTGVRWVMPTLAAGFAAASILVVLGLSTGNGETAASELLEVGDREIADSYRTIESSEVPTHDQVLGMLVEEES
ncbi:MAG: anti-sigma factor [Candidatus Coatesbacteria bacterium]